MATLTVGTVAVIEYRGVERFVRVVQAEASYCKVYDFDKGGYRTFSFQHIGTVRVA